MKLLQVVPFAQLVNDLSSRRHSDVSHICISPVAMQVTDVPVATFRVFCVFVESRRNPSRCAWVGVERLYHDPKELLLSFKFTRHVGLHLHSPGIDARSSIPVLIDPQDRPGARARDRAGFIDERIKIARIVRGSVISAAQRPSCDFRSRYASAIRRVTRAALDMTLLVVELHGGHFAGQSAGRPPIVHSFGGSPSAVFWYSQLPQTVQFQLLLTFVIWLGGPNALAPAAARSPCGGTLDGLPTSSRQASHGCTSVSHELFRIVARGLSGVRITEYPNDPRESIESDTWAHDFIQGTALCRQDWHSVFDDAEG
ncbi:hypothetical protein [Paraburkholderia sp. BL10I2N1]|uniref:hypothetical protein n=1 Tax=Paraburkholderia sp. BL10I2N1 TaxID=1938796 RepID=UPI001414E759|nr:hypothetical protein [Paraburkholderia sp. BL10I2N1]